MANELNIQLDPFSDSGLTLIAKVFNSDGTQLGSNTAMTEVGSRAYYTASFSLVSVVDGAYLISFETATDFYGQGVLYVKIGDEIDLSDVETEALAAVRETNIVSEVNTNETKIDLIETKAQADARQSSLIGEHNDTQADIAALNDISPAQVNTEVDTALGDYDAPTKTELDAAESNIIASIPSVGNIADGVWDEPYNQHTTAGTFGKLMDLLRKANRAIDGEITGTPTTATFQTNVSGYVSGAFDHELIVFTSGALDGEARPILEYSATNGTFTFEEEWSQAPSSSDEFVILPYHTHPISEIQSGLAKTIELNAVETNLLAQHTATQSLINALNDLSEAQVKAQADQALIDYDAPTKAELDSVETAILGAINGLNNLTQQEVAEAVWDYLQSTTTVSASMKEAILKTLVNANLIPAAI